MEINCKKNLLTVSIEGDFDLSLCSELRESLVERIESRGINRVIFEMEKVTFIDSSGLGLVLLCYKKLAPAGGEVAIKNLSPRLKPLFEMAGIDRILHISLLKEVRHGG